MLDALFIISIIGAVVQVFKEKFGKEVPTENWANEELYRRDIMNGVSVEQRIKKLKNGKYKLEESVNLNKKKNSIKNSRYTL